MGKETWQPWARGWGPMDSSPYTTRFQHRIRINPIMLNLNLVFQNNKKSYVPREKDVSYFI
jgi:hypothetical protein